MALSERQLRILSVIDAGNTTGESIADALGSSMQMLRYYLDTMAEDGYLKTAKVYDNATREFQIVRAYLTDKGKLTLEQLGLAKKSPEPPSQNNKTPEPSTEKLPERTSPQQLQIQEIDEILQSLDVLQRIVNQLPEERQEVISVYLSDLQDEIKIVYRRKSQRIRAYFLAVLGTTLPLIKQTPQAPTFTEHARKISQKLNIAVKLPV